jgi:flagellar biosynthetic protein FlhB
MAAQDDGAERNQDPTQKRLDEARRDGRILTSKEIAVFAAMAAGSLVMFLLPDLGPWAATRWAAHLRLGSGDMLEAALMPALWHAGIEVLALTLLVGGPVAVAAVLAQWAMGGGLHWSHKGYAFKGEKLNPGAGLMRMVSLPAVVELAKAVAKVGLLGAVAVWVVMQGLPVMTDLGHMPPGAAAGIMAQLVVQLFGAMTLMLGVIGLADLMWEKHRLTQSLRMTFDEVKREHREDNGSPEMKGKLRQMQMTTSRRGARERAALPDVPGASVIITNPSHFAVALRYRSGQDDAPQIVAMGRDRMAAQVIERAKAAGVPILRLPPLARALYFTGDIGTPIHEGLYTAVATVLAHIWRVEKGMREDLHDVEVPRDLRFDARGHRDGQGR